MTTIAWDSRFLAADSLRCFGEYRMPGDHRKIITRAPDGTEYRIEDGRPLAFAATGFGGLRPIWIDWYMGGQKREDAPSSVQGQWSGYFLVLTQVSNWDNRPLMQTCTCETPYLEEITGPMAWGSGGDFAIGAMHAGKNALEAVEIAKACSATSGGPVHFLDTLNWDAGVQDYGRPLTEVVKELRAVKCDWDGVENPLEALTEIREGA